MGSFWVSGAFANEQMSERLKDSLVYIKISAYPYNQFQPWKQMDVQDRSTYGCAVGPYEVLTIAFYVPDATYISVRTDSQNKYVPAKVEVIDYESDLCLLRLDPNELAKPLVPVKFRQDFKKGADVQSYWFSYKGHVYTGRGILDRAEVSKTPRSYGQFLNYIIRCF